MSLLLLFSRSFCCSNLIKAQTILSVVFDFLAENRLGTVISRIQRNFSLCLFDVRRPGAFVDSRLADKDLFLALADVEHHKVLTDLVGTFPMHTDIPDNICDLLGIDRTMICHCKIGFSEREHLAVSLGRCVRSRDDVCRRSSSARWRPGRSGPRSGQVSWQDNIGSLGIVHEEVVGVGVT